MNMAAMIVEQTDDSSNHSISTTSTARNHNDIIMNDSTHEGETDQNSNDTSTKENNSLSRKETKQVDILRNIVILILILSAAAIAITVYYLTKNAQTEQFKTQYEGSASKILKSFETVLDKIDSTYSIGIAATIQGMNRSTSKNDSKSLWPFVTLPSFEQRAASARALSNTLLVSVQPIITQEYRDEWEEYSMTDAKDWIADGLKFQRQMGIDRYDLSDTPLEEVILENYTNLPIYYDYYDTKGTEIKRKPSPLPGPYLPTWQTSPILKSIKVNMNLLQEIDHRNSIEHAINTGTAVFSHYEVGTRGYLNSTNSITSWIATLRSMEMNTEVEYLGAPVTRLFLPIYDSFDAKDRNVVAIMMNIIHWRSYFFNILPDNINGLVVIMENTCYGSVTFDVSGSQAVTRGLYDGHDPKYSVYRKSTTLNSSLTIIDGTKSGLSLDSSGCLYNVHVYPSQTFSDDYITPLPILITFAVSMVFIFTICIFILYNQLVEKRQVLVLTKAVHSTAIVSSLFPKQVHDRLMMQQQQEHDEKKQNTNNTSRLKSFLSNNNNNNNDVTSSGIPVGGGTTSRPIADLFPHCTVLFADIAGFTAWSSTRGPEQVFSLLQTVYQSFDIVAKRHKVFKVETIGDCYVAATGLPEAQPNHAIQMARFARDCQLKMGHVTRDLEISLGPDCSDLKMRIGMHSGPVTAGVLMGDRARFQLFGDTVNTAARMESTGIKGKNQISVSTAELLIAAGKENWVKLRDDMVEAKGKGFMKTFFLDFESGRRVSSETNSNAGTSSIVGNDSENEHAAQPTELVRQERLVDWITELLLKHVKLIVAKSHVGAADDNVFYEYPSGMVCLDEVKEVIGMARFDNKSKIKSTCENIDDITESIYPDLRNYVRQISAMYNKNSFHSFEHACHVTMSCSKLLNRIVSPLVYEEESMEASTSKPSLDCHLHYSTFGINSDPIVQFAILVGALVHDVDHRGCSNAQLIQEEHQMGAKYRNKSVAEQNSFDIAWGTLMSDQFSTLRKLLFWSNKNLTRFRSVLVNVVLATDIFDKELNDLRKKRWDTAFSVGDSIDQQSPEIQKLIAKEHIDAAYEDEYQMLDWSACQQWTQTLLLEDMKATIVIEHIIQASDVSHTMQHWHVYQKWNHKLFHEMYNSYKSGRMAVNPSSFWYQGELQFLDNYVIPLAKKLKECGVFGVSSDEYLDYAVKNRLEWEERGESIVEELVASYDEDK